MVIGIDYRRYRILEDIVLQKPVLKKPSTTLREMENLSLFTPVGPAELILQALSHEQRGYRVFIDRL